MTAVVEPMAQLALLWYQCNLANFSWFPLPHYFSSQILLKKRDHYLLFLNPKQQLKMKTEKKKHYICGMSHSKTVGFEAFLWGVLLSRNTVLRSKLMGFLQNIVQIMKYMITYLILIYRFKIVTLLLPKKCTYIKKHISNMQLHCELVKFKIITDLSTYQPTR